MSFVRLANLLSDKPNAVIILTGLLEAKTLQYLLQPAYNFSINIYKNESKQNGEKMVNKIFSELDESKEMSELMTELSSDPSVSALGEFSDLEDLKGFIINAIANGTMSDIKNRAKYNFPDLTYYPCFGLNMDLARYIYLPLDNRCWNHLADKTEKDFLPNKPLDEKSQPSSLDELKIKIKEVLTVKQSRFNCFFHENDAKNENIKNLVDKCWNENQIKNLLLTALNVTIDEYDPGCGIKSVENTKLYQMLLTNLQLTNNFIHQNEQSKRISMRHSRS